MSLIRNFQVAGGTIFGRDHRMVGKNNHDALAIVQTDDAIIGLVCDGCGSGLHSEVGAKIGAQLIANMLLANIQRLGPTVKDFCAEIPFPYWERTRQDVLAQLRVLVQGMGGSFSQTVNDYFLFTTVGFLILPQYTTVFSIGDGMYILNNGFNEIGPFPNNAPPYLSYGLVDSSLGDEHPELLKWQIHRQLANEHVDQILIGTDGVIDLANAHDRHLPGKDALVGPLSQFWTKDIFFSNRDAIRRRLWLANRENVALDRERQCLVKSPALLADDTTLVVARRTPLEGS